MNPAVPSIGFRFVTFCDPFLSQKLKSTCIVTWRSTSRETVKRPFNRRSKSNPGTGDPAAAFCYISCIPNRMLKPSKSIHPWEKLPFLMIVRSWSKEIFQTALLTFFIATSWRKYPDLDNLILWFWKNLRFIQLLMTIIPRTTSYILIPQAITCHYLSLPPI